MSTLKTASLQHPDASSNTINLSSAGNVSITGNVGIGTNSPTSKLDLGGNNVAGISSINGGQVGGRRNLIINGAFTIAQRSTSETGVNTNGYKTVDRWNYNRDTASVLTMSQDTNAPDGFANSFKILVTTTATPGTTDQDRIEQRIESQNVQHLKYGTSGAQQLTVSFWVKTNKTGNWSVGLYMDSSGYTISQAYTVNSADTWEYKTVTFAANTAQAMTGNFRLWFTFAAGTDRKSGTSNTWSTSTTNRAVGQSVNLLDTINNYWQITGVQLEVGDTATPFEHRSYGEELSLCQRYFYRIGGAAAPICMAMAYSSSEAYGHVRLPQQMRVVPSLSYSSFPRLYKPSTQALATLFQIDGGNSSSQDLRVRGDKSGHFTAGHASWFQLNDSSQTVDFDSEL